MKILLYQKERQAFNLSRNPGGGYPYIYGIKGRACVWVMIGHILSQLQPLYNENIYRQAELFFDYLYVLGNNVAMFSLISGFLAALSFFRRDPSKCIFKYCLKRYFRFAVPCFFVLIWAYVIQVTVGYAIRYESFDFIDMICYSFFSMFCGDSSLNLPFWMMGDLFWGSILAFVGLYLGSIIPRYKWKQNYNRHVNVLYLVLVIILLCLPIFMRLEGFIYWCLQKWVLFDVIIGVVFLRL